VKISLYHLYIVKCSDDTLYTGITTDVTRRVNEHNTSKRAAKYTSIRRPVELLFSKECVSRSDAIKEELRVKKLPREKKFALAQVQTKVQVKEKVRNRAKK